MLRKQLLQVWKVVRGAALLLAENDPFRMAGATAFFTTFALPPILMIIASTLGLVVDRRAVGRALLDPLSHLFGADSIAYVQQTIRSFRALQHNYLIAAGIFIFLLFVATSLFKVIRNSINQVWYVRGLPHSGIRSMLLSRALSVAVILAGGLLFLSVQLVDAGQHMLGRYLGEDFAQAGIYIGRALNIIVVTFITAVWFYLLFTLLPDGRPDRRIAAGGAVATGVLFTAGKAVLSVLLRPVQVSSFYGVSGAIALVLLFMFYSSIFLYFGAAVIQMWSNVARKPITPKRHAEKYHIEAEEAVPAVV